MDKCDFMKLRKESEKLLMWAHERNPGPWTEHCRIVARTAETIAKLSKLDTNRAYVSGLLHDIGRYEGVRGLHHVYSGYELMKEKGYEIIAEICLSHSFPYQNIGSYGESEYDCTPNELFIITSFLSKTTYNNYDKLIQLCDSMVTAQGVCIIEKRLIDVAQRYGFNDFTLKRWNAIFELKKYFDKLCGKNIYELFYDEIKIVIFK